MPGRGGMTTKERQRRFRQIRKEKGLVRGDVWVYPDQWPKIREIEREMQEEKSKEKA
jgi:hypothetical protein